MLAVPAAGRAIPNAPVRQACCPSCSNWLCEGCDLHCSMQYEQHAAVQVQNMQHLVSNMQALVQNMLVLGQEHAVPQSCICCDLAPMQHHNQNLHFASHLSKALCAVSSVFAHAVHALQVCCFPAWPFTWQPLANVLFQSPSPSPQHCCPLPCHSQPQLWTAPSSGYCHVKAGHHCLEPQHHSAWLRSFSLLQMMSCFRQLLSRAVCFQQQWVSSAELRRCSQSWCPFLSCLLQL